MSEMDFEEFKNNYPIAQTADLAREVATAVAKFIATSKVERSIAFSAIITTLNAEALQFLRSSGFSDEKCIAAIVQSAELLPLLTPDIPLRGSLQ